MLTAIARDLGGIDYQDAWALQDELHLQVLSARGHPTRDGQAGHLLTCQHPHVYTLGRSGDRGNLLIGPEALSALGATFCQTNRGGDITYHGPGQLVAYPILDLGKLRMGVKDYVQRLEESVIRTLLTFGIRAKRWPGASGVWVGEGELAQPAKICAIGVRVSRSITMHGLALNVSPDLQYFRHINPCGYTQAGVTSMALELGQGITMAQVREPLLACLSECFGMEMVFA